MLLAIPKATTKKIIQKIDMNRNDKGIKMAYLKISI